MSSIKNSRHNAYNPPKNRLGAYFVGLYLFSVPAFSYSPDMNLGIIPQALGFLVVLYGVFDVASRKRVNLGKDIQLYGYFAAWAVFTYLISAFAGNLQQLGTLGTLVKVAAVTMAASQLIKTKNDFFLALAIYSTSIFLVSYLNYDLIQNLHNTTQIRGTDRFDGTLANANTAAMYALSIVWASLTIYFGSRFPRLTRNAFLLCLPISVWIIGFSGSKKGLLGIAIFSAMISWWVIKRHRKSFLKFFGALIASASLLTGALYYVYHSPFFNRLELFFSGSDTGSTAERYYLASTALALWIDDIKTFILGVGYDNFRYHNQLHTYSHSTVTETLVTTGIIGFVLYFSGLYLLGKRLFIIQRHPYSQDSRTPIYMGLVFVLLFVLFNISAVMCASREFWPLVGIISSYSTVLLPRQSPVSIKHQISRIPSYHLPPQKKAYKP